MSSGAGRAAHAGMACLGRGAAGGGLCSPAKLALWRCRGKFLSTIYSPAAPSSLPSPVTSLVTSPATCRVTNHVTGQVTSLVTSGIVEHRHSVDCHVIGIAMPHSSLVTSQVTGRAVEHGRLCSNHFSGTGPRASRRTAATRGLAPSQVTSHPVTVAQSFTSQVTNRAPAADERWRILGRGNPVVHHALYSGIASSQGTRQPVTVTRSFTSQIPERRLTAAEEGKKLQVRGVPVVHHALYSAPQLPPRHRFPMPVFQIIHDTLIEDGVVDPRQFVEPPAMPRREDVLLAHSDEYLTQFETGTLDPMAMRRIGFPWTKTLVDRTLSEVSGTIQTAELALAYGLACNTAGGTHHAHRDFGSGFCILNDIAVTALTLLQRGLVERVAIVDLDVHQGDGTASILQSDSRAFTFSMHCGANFPARKQKSDLDVDVPQGSGDKEFLSLLADHLPHVLRTFRPDIVLYDAGVDTHEKDALGKLNMTDEGLYRRELQVIDTCLGFGIPVAGLNGGGYDDDLKVLARRHGWLHHASKEMWEMHNL